MLGDRMEMAHSIEAGCFLDHHVVETICKQPVNQKIRMTEKYVLREAVRDVITDTVAQKHPFLSPPATLNPTTFSTYVQDTA
jgi:asparagine synthase (glutamine-hydrolysing)